MSIISPYWQRHGKDLLFTHYLVQGLVRVGWFYLLSSSEEEIGLRKVKQYILWSYACVPKSENSSLPQGTP